MLDDPGDWEVLSFFLLVAVFEVWERARPARPVNRLADLKLDVLSFALAVLMHRLSREAVDGLIGGASPGVVLGGLEAVRAWPAGVKIAIALVLVDGMIYWIHRAQHRFDLLWLTHRWHHSIEEMYWFAGFRTSFLHSFIYSIPQTIIPMQLFHLTPLEAGLGYSIGLFIQFWEHTNVRADIGWLKHVFITPQYHRVHHSATFRQRMNLGTTFSFWDRMCGTYIDPDTLPDTDRLGLGGVVPAKEVPRMLIGV